MPNVKRPLAKTKHAKILPQLKKLYVQYPRLTYQQIAGKLNLPSHTVNDLIYRMIKRGVLRERKNLGGYDPTEAQITRLREIGHMRVNEGKTWREIGEHYNLSYQAVLQFVRQHLPELADAYKQDNQEWINQLIELYKGGMTRQADLASKLKKSDSTISIQLGRLFKDGTLQRSNIPHKPTMDKVKEIHALRQQGMTWHNIAKTFGREPKNYTTFGELYRRHKHLVDE